MSEQFLEFVFPCKDCLVRACCKEKPDDKGKKSVLFYDTNPRCLAVPKLPLNVTYHKGVLECWANLGARLVNSVQKSEDPVTLTEKHNNIPMQYIALMGKLSYILCHMVNTTSWNLGELKEFDQIEIKRRLKNLFI